MSTEFGSIDAVASKQTQTNMISSFNQKQYEQQKPNVLAGGPSSLSPSWNMSLASLCPYGTQSLDVMFYI